MRSNCTDNQRLFHILEHGGTPEDYRFFDETVAEMVRAASGAFWNRHFILNSLEDYVQDTHERLLKQRVKLQHQENFHGLARKIATNCMNNATRKKRASTQEDEFTDQLRKQAASPIDDWIRTLDGELFREFVLQHLTAAQLQLLDWIFHEDLSYAEIADRLGLEKENTVAGRMRTVRNKLYELLTQHRAWLR